MIKILNQWISLDESGTELKMGTIGVVGGQSRVLTYLNEARYALRKSILNKAIDLTSNKSKHSEGNVLQKIPCAY